MTDLELNECDQLLAAIVKCNEQLYQYTDIETKAGPWQQPAELIEQRGLFLQKLSSIIDTLDPQQIDNVGQLYESMLVSDKQFMGLVEVERLKTRDSLRAIKNAEKAIPTYNSVKEKY